MSILSVILTELGRGDDQGNDWYGWATNQMGHALIGLVIAVVGLTWLADDALGAVLLSIGLALAKEAADLISGPVTWRAVRDGLRDLAFWSTGAALGIATSIGADALIALSISSLIALLIAGIVPRVRRAIASRSAAA